MTTTIMPKTIRVTHRMSVVYGDAKVRLDGNLTPDVIRLFHNGQCHALAIALHELLGGEIVIRIDGRGEVDHFLLRLPDGRYLDVMGLHETATDAFAPDMVVCDPDYALLRYRKLGLYKPNMVFARHFAPIIAEFVTRRTNDLFSSRKEP